MNEVENRFVMGLKENQREVVEEICNGMMRRMAQWLMARGCGREESKDLCYQALQVALLKVRDPHFVLTCRFDTYLHAIVKNLWRKSQEKSKREIITVDFPERGIDPDINEQLEKMERLVLIRDAMNRLGDGCRKILNMYHHEGKSMDEIARELAFKSPEYARLKKHRCVQQFGKLMHNDSRYRELASNPR